MSSLSVQSFAMAQVYMAKYSYDPVEYSPNENPESELKLNAGEYIFVYGHMDEVSAATSHVSAASLGAA